jgi:hypothetical protein
MTKSLLCLDDFYSVCAKVCGKIFTNIKVLLKSGFKLVWWF